jgi:hypothetical protein
MKVSGEKVTGSLTPAQKAIAVYAVATAKLGDYLKEAGKRSHDAANVQARLSAEWDNAKDRLGTALLPAVTKISTAMANWLHRMNQSGKLQQHINSVMHTAKEILNAVKSVWLALAPPITKVVHALGGAGNATKILIGLWAAWKVGGILSSLGKVVGRLLDIRGGAIKARVAMMALSTGGVLVGLAAIAIVAKKVADNIKGLQEQQIAAEEHTAAKGSGVRRALIPSLAKDINEMKARGVSGADIITNLRMRLSGRTEGSDAANALIADAFAFSSKLNRNRQTLVDEFAASAKKSAKSTADDVKKAADVVKNAAKGAAGAGAKGAAAGMDADTKAAVQKAKEGITELKTRMKDANQSARDQIVQTKQSLRDLQSNLADAVTQMKDDVASSVQEAQSNLISIGGTLGDSIGQILDKPFQIAGDRISRAQNKLALRFDLANAKLDAQARKLTAQQSKLGLENDQEALRALRRQVVLPGGRHLSEDPTKAIAQLEALEKKMQPGQRAGIEAFIRQYRGAVLTVAQDKLGIKQQTAGNKRAVAEGRLNLQTERLKVRQDAATVMKETAQRQIADMTAALASGKIKLTTFTKNIAHLMGREGISYKRAGHLLGSAFESGFRSQVKGLIDQATAIGEARRGGIQVTGTGMEPKIVRPLNVLHADQKKIEHIHQQIGHQQITLQRRIAHASEQQAKFSAQIRDRQTALSKRIAKAAEKTQAAAEKMASVAVNPAAASLLQNPGTQSDRSAALTGTTG